MAACVVCLFLRVNTNGRTKKKKEKMMRQNFGETSCPRVQLVCTGTYSARSLTCHDKESVPERRERQKREPLMASRSGEKGDEMKLTPACPLSSSRKEGKKQQKSGKLSSKRTTKPRPAEGSATHTQRTSTNTHTRAYRKFFSVARERRETEPFGHTRSSSVFFFFKSLFKKTWLRSSLVWV